VGKLEESWNRTEFDRAATPLLINCTNVSYFDVPGMVYLISRIIERARLGLETKLALPQRPEVANFLRIWNVDTTIERACGFPFSTMLHPSSTSIWSHLQTMPRTSHEERLPASFYPIQATLRSSRRFTPNLAAEWSESWRSVYILSVLNRMLGGYGERIASHVIHEAIMNGIRHPGARVLLTASSSIRYPSRSNSKSSRYLTICVWDDGASIVETLRGASAFATEFYPRQSSLFKRDLEFTRIGIDKEEKTIRLTNQTAIPVDSEDALLLLASTFPGVTSDPSSEASYAHPNVIRENIDYARPGMGLFVLCSTVAEVFGGKVTIRSGRSRMSIQSGPIASENAPRLLNVKVTDLGPNSLLLGNQVTIRIPRRVLPTE
jgi:hypothetical protein